MINISNIILKNGFSMPILGFGTWKMGQGITYGASETDQDSIKTIQAAVEHGVLHIDTAEAYGNGYVEEMIAKALVGIDRSKLFITSKVRGSNSTKNGIKTAIQASLKRLQMDYLDLYLIHNRDLNVSLEEGILAMNDLVDEGLIRNFGVSNYGVESMQKSLAVTRHPIVVNQVQYNLEHREAEVNGVLKFCQENNIILEAWAPVRPINQSTIEIPIVKEICEKYKATPYQVAINWLINQPNVSTLFKTNHVERLAENLESLNFKLENDEIEKLRTEFPDQVFENPGWPMR
jgi:diketogulonate reductase-like aldo/keto reductase